MLYTKQDDLFDNNDNIEHVPFVAVGPDELGDAVGEFAYCKVCGNNHPVEYGHKVLADGTRVPSKLLAFINCTESGKSYLVGIDGKLIKSHTHVGVDGRLTKYNT